MIGAFRRNLLFFNPSRIETPSVVDDFISNHPSQPHYLFPSRYIQLSRCVLHRRSWITTIPSMERTFTTSWLKFGRVQHRLVFPCCNPLPSTTNADLKSTVGWAGGVQWVWAPTTFGFLRDRTALANEIRCHSGSPPQKGIATYSLSSNRQNVNAHALYNAVFNTWRRSKNQIGYWLPPFAIAYFTLDWAIKKYTPSLPWQNHQN